MEAIQNNMKEMKMKVEESEIGIKIKKGTTEFVHEHEEEINKVKSKVEETKTKVEERIINTKEKRDSRSTNEEKKDDDDVESPSNVKEDRDDPTETTDGEKRPSIKKRVEELAYKVKPEILKTKSKVFGIGPLVAAATTTGPKVVTENEDSTSNVEVSADEVSADDVESAAEDSPSSDTEKTPELSDEPEDDWADVLPPPDTEEGKEGEDKITPPTSSSSSSSIPDYYKSNSKHEAANTKTDGSEKSHEKHINKLKKSIEDIRFKIETTIKDVSDKEKVKKIVNPLKMKLMVAKTKLIALKEGKSKSDDGEDEDDDKKEENFVTTAENVTKTVVGNARNALKQAASKAGLLDDDDEKKTAAEDNDDKKDDENVEETKSKLPKVVENARDALKKAVSKVLITEDDKKKLAEDSNIDNNNMTEESAPCDTTKCESDVKTDTADAAADAADAADAAETDTAAIVNESDVKDVVADVEGDNESK